MIQLGDLPIYLDFGGGKYQDFRPSPPHVYTLERYDTTTFS